MIIDKTKVAKECLAEHAEYLDRESKSEGFHQLEDPDGLMVMVPTAEEFAARVLADGEALGAGTGLGALAIVISPGEGKTLSAGDWIEVTHIALEVLGWDDSPRKAVLHDKERPVSEVSGLKSLPQHMHLDVPGYEPVTGLRRSLFKFNERGEMAARCIENYLGHRHVLGNHAQANERELRELAEARTECDRPLSYDPAATAAGIREEAARQLRDAGHDPSDDPDILMAAWTKHCSPRQLRNDPVRKAEAEGINAEKITAAFHRAWSEASSGAEFSPLFFKGRCGAYGLQLTEDKRGNVLALDGEGKCHSLTAYMRRVQEAGLDAKKPVDIPVLLAALKTIRLPKLAEARRKAIPAARKAYTKERGILGRQRGLARKKKDLAAEKAAEALIEALDRRSLPLLTSPRMKPPCGDQELRKGNVHFGLDLPGGLLVRGEGPVDCDRAVKAFLPRMTSDTLVIDIRGGRREDHLELTRAARKRRLKVEGGYETRTPGFELVPAPKSKSAPTVVPQPIVAEQPKPPAKDADIIVQLPPKTPTKPEHAPPEETSIIVSGGVASGGTQRPVSPSSVPKTKLQPRRNPFTAGATLASAIPATMASTADTAVPLAARVAEPVPDPYARQKARRKELTDYTRHLLDVECRREVSALLEATKQVDAFGGTGTSWRRELDRMRKAYPDPEKFQEEVQKTITYRSNISIRAVQKKDALEKATRNVVKAAERIVDTVWQARQFAEAAGGFDAEQFGWLGTIHLRTKKETEWLRHTEYADAARSFDFNLDPARARRRSADESFPMTDDELDAAMAKAVFAPYIEPAPFQGDEVVEDHVREMDEVGLDKPAQEAVAVAEPEAPAKDVPPVSEPGHSAPVPAVSTPTGPIHQPAAQKGQAATTQGDSGNKQMSPAVLRALQGSR